MKTVGFISFASQLSEITVLSHSKSKIFMLGFLCIVLIFKLFSVVSQICLLSICVGHDCSILIFLFALYYLCNCIYTEIRKGSLGPMKLKSQVFLGIRSQTLVF